MLQQVNLQVIFHQNAEQLALFFHTNAATNSIVKKIKNIKWSQSNKCWYLPLSKENYQIVAAQLKGHCIINKQSLETYLLQRKQVVSIKQITQEKKAYTKSNITNYAISAYNLQQLDLLVKTLHLKAYSTNTIRLYRDEVLTLCRHLKQNPISALQTNHIKSYLLWLLKEKKYSETKVHSTINALKFYFEQVLHQPKIFIEIPRPKSPYKYLQYMHNKK